MTEDRMGELRAMFDDLADRSVKRATDPARRYQAFDKVSLDFALMAIATMSGALVEIMDVLHSHESTLLLQLAHIENLIERVYLLEGGDLMADRQGHHHQPPGHL